MIHLHQVLSAMIPVAKYEEVKFDEEYVVKRTYQID